MTRVTAEFGGSRQSLDCLRSAYPGSASASSSRARVDSCSCPDAGRNWRWHAMRRILPERILCPVGFGERRSIEVHRPA